MTETLRCECPGCEAPGEVWEDECVLANGDEILLEEVRCRPCRVLDCQHPEPESD